MCLNHKSHHFKLCFVHQINRRSWECSRLFESSLYNIAIGLVFVISVYSLCSLSPTAFIFMGHLVLLGRVKVVIVGAVKAAFYGSCALSMAVP